MIWNGAAVRGSAWDDVRQVRESDKTLARRESETSRLQNLIHRYINQPSPELFAEILLLREAVLGCLRRAGFSVEMTVHASSVQDAYIYGFALQQRDLSPETPEDFAAVAQQQMRDYAAALGGHPHLVEVVGGYVAESGFDYEAEFLFGLDVILDRLEQLLDER